ncbi:hypothetical protein MNR01_01045 [Lysobacter sp. S4-A87]|uniref:hypothetical protein n=1 Tax=Lysobacter sp. S4-A87 TaxID=2925843 RepID=UPI001F52F937|nr:hypothetical protein [Lysobacter sp. S4-A87]UNK49659.1 hypothetical protein MNR01_01045 [Lysobacter sp. S4-A87]
MKSLIVGMFALTLAGGALAQSPKVLVRADSGDVQVAGRAVEKANSSGAEAGDVVVVNGGEAYVTYSNGCTVKVTGSYTVQDAAPAKCPSLGKVGSDTNYAMVGTGIAVAAGALALASGGGGDDAPAETPKPPKPSSP